MTTIFEYIENNDIDGIKKSIQAGVDINQKGDLGQTPLHLAVNYENLDMIVSLIIQGAEVNAIDDDGESPIFMISSYDINAFKLLLESGANPNIKNNAGRTILDQAFEENAIDIIELLQSHGGHGTIKPSDFGLSDETYYYKL